jgi:hypothetical protein
MKCQLYWQFVNLELKFYYLNIDLQVTMHQNHIQTYTKQWWIIIEKLNGLLLGELNPSLKWPCTLQ